MVYLLPIESSFIDISFTSDHVIFLPTTKPTGAFLHHVLCCPLIPNRRIANHLQRPEEQEVEVPLTDDNIDHEAEAIFAGTIADPFLATEEDNDLERDTNPTSGAITQQTFLAKMIEGPVGDGLVSSHIGINTLMYDLSFHMYS